MDDVDPGEFTERTSRKASSRSLWRGALLIAAIALAAGLEARRLAEPDHDHAPDLRRMFGGERALETIKHAARVEAHRLGPLPLAISESTATPADYPVSSGPV